MFLSFSSDCFAPPEALVSSWQESIFSSFNIFLLLGTWRGSANIRLEAHLEFAWGSQQTNWGCKTHLKLFHLFPLHFVLRGEVVHLASCCVVVVYLQVFSRRRPTGWTPFRSVDQVKPSPPPSTTVVKEESSEEDITSFKPSASPAVSSPSDSTTPSPFHCPSKPWKPFNPASPAAPTGAPSQPAADLVA